MQIKYLHFVCAAGEELQNRLTEHGAEGWRLHTCDPVPTVGPNGSGTLNAFVVMDMQDFSDEEVQTLEEADRGAIRMKS
jgi:hypothetical protein